MTLDVSAIIVNDRFMVPVRFISESMGLEVGWSETGKVVQSVVWWTIPF